MQNRLNDKKSKKIRRKCTSQCKINNERNGGQTKLGIQLFFVCSTELSCMSAVLAIWRWMVWEDVLQVLVYFHMDESVYEKHYKKWDFQRLPAWGNIASLLQITVWECKVSFIHCQYSWKSACIEFDLAV